MNEEQDPSSRRRVDVTRSQGVQVGTGNVQHNHFGPREPVQWPLRSGLAPAAADCLQPRAEEMAALDRAGTPATMVLTGLGGVGKSQIAAEFRRRWLAGPGAEGLTVWLDGSSRGSVVEGLAAVAQAIAEPGTTAVPEDPEGAAAWLRAWLAATERPWLVVVDDLADPASLRGTGPAAPSLWLEGPAGRMLITTRRTDASLLMRARQVAVGLFSLRQSCDYLRDKLGTEAGAPGLAQDLQHLPLALAQAAAFIVDHEETCADYRRRFADRASRLDDLFPPESLVDDYYRTVATTWWISIEAADALAPRGAARPLLELAAHYSPQGFPPGVLEEPDAVAYVRARASATVVGPRDCRDALIRLARLSLLTFDDGDDDRPRIVSVHPLVGRVAREGAADVVGAASVSLDALSAHWDVDERDCDVVEVLRASAETAMELAGEGLWTDGAHLLLFQYGNHLDDRGRLAEAEAYLAALVEECIERLGAQHPHTLDARHNLLHIRAQRRRTTDTVEEAAQLVADCVAALGADHHTTLAARRIAASCRDGRDEPGGARDELERLCADQARLLGEHHLDTVKTRMMLARARGASGDAAAAARDLTELADNCARVFGPDHRTTLDVRTSLGIWRGAAGDHAGAVATLRGLVEECEWAFGADHPATLSVRHHLATEESVADPRRAERALRGLVDDRRKALGPDHPETLDTELELARARGDAGDPTGAAEEVRRLLAEHVARHGPDDHAGRGMRRELAFWLGAASDPVAATAVQRQVVADHAHHDGPDAPATLAARHSLGLLVASNDVQNGRCLLDEVLADLRRVLPADHPQVLAARADVVALHVVTGDAAALAELRRLLRDQLRVLGPDHELTRSTVALLLGAGLATAAEGRLGAGPDSPSRSSPPKLR